MGHSELDKEFVLHGSLVVKHHLVTSTLSVSFFTRQEVAYGTMQHARV